MSVEVKMTGSEGDEEEERKARKIWLRTWGIGVVESIEASWITVDLVRR